VGVFIILQIIFSNQHSYSCNSVDDSYLQRTVSAIPKQAIFLIEDIDCAFLSREELDEMEEMPYFSYPRKTKSGQPMSQVTLSGLLNVLDGVGSDEGKIFFATVCPCSLVLDSDDLDLIWALI
jgi:chaperone BCS1